MAHGLQILLLDESLETNEQQQAFIGPLFKQSGNLIDNIMKSGNVRWINQEQDINPTPELKDKIEITTTEPTHLKRVEKLSL